MELAARYARHLELQEWSLTADRNDSLDKITQEILECNNSQITLAVAKHDTVSGWMKTDKRLRQSRTSKYMKLSPSSKKFRLGLSQAS